MEVLDHWEATGDISEHKMCGDCRSRNERNECPFCKEVCTDPGERALLID